MRKSHPLSLVLACMAAIACCAAQAEDTGYYGYLATGQSKSTGRKTEIGNSIIAAGVAPSALTSSADETDTTWKLQVGYRFNPNFAVEGGYVDLGKFTYDARATVPAATRHGDIKIDGWNVDLVGYLPFSESLTGFAKLGAFAYDVTFTCSGTGIPCSNQTRSASGTSTHYGLGVAWTFSRNWFLRAEYDVYDRVGDSFNRTGTQGTTRADITTTTIGVGYHF